MNDVIFNLIVNLLCLVGYIYLAVVQYLQMRRNTVFKLTTQRRLLMSVFILATITLVPVIEFQILRLIGESGDFMRQIATIMSPINRVITLVLIIAFAHSRVRDEIE